MIGLPSRASIRIQLVGDDVQPVPVQTPQRAATAGGGGADHGVNRFGGAQHFAHVRVDWVESYARE